MVVLVIPITNTTFFYFNRRLTIIKIILDKLRIKPFPFKLIYVNTPNLENKMAKITRNLDEDYEPLFALEDSDIDMFNDDEDETPVKRRQINKEFYPWEDEDGLDGFGEEFNND
jgi:hypothetical protein